MSSIDMPDEHAFSSVDAVASELRGLQVRHHELADQLRHAQADSKSVRHLLMCVFLVLGRKDGPIVTRDDFREVVEGLAQFAGEIQEPELFGASTRALAIVLKRALDGYYPERPETPRPAMTLVVNNEPR